MFIKYKNIYVLHQIRIEGKAIVEIHLKYQKIYGYIRWL
jgi:hypothetical protein